MLIAFASDIFPLLFSISFFALFCSSIFDDVAVVVVFCLIENVLRYVRCDLCGCMCGVDCVYAACACYSHYARVMQKNTYTHITHTQHVTIWQQI